MLLAYEELPKVEASFELLLSLNAYISENNND